jgi:hypothetical protein
MPTQTHPLVFRDNHLYVSIEGALWVYDTGSPNTFGETTGNPFNGASLLRRNMDEFSGYLGVKVAGLIGTDTLNALDHLLDLRPDKMSLTCSNEPLACDGNAHGLRFISPTPGSAAGIPTLLASLGGTASDYIFDTGAPLSYHIGPVPEGAVPCCTKRDFWPSIGYFLTETFHVQTHLDASQRWLKFGRPPAQLEQTLKGYHTCGIIGNEVMRGRVTGYFPRRSLLILQA